jgi:cytochrome P450
MATLPPGPTSSRHELIRFARNPLAYFLDLAATYGEIVYVRIGTRETYVISAPDALREILVEHADKFEKTSHTKESTGTFLGNGLLVSSGATHRRHRRTLQTMFTRTWVERYSQAMIDASLELLSEWQHGQTRDVADDMMRLALSIVGRTIFGASGIARSDDLAQAASVMQHYASDTLIRDKLTSITPEAVQAAAAILDRLVEEVLAQADQTGGENLIALMRAAIDPETGERMTDREIRDEALTMLMAGHETTANALAWTLYLLAKHPAIAARMSEEIAQVCGNDLPTTTHLPTLQYTERVIRESLRLYPPAWLLGRTPIEPVEIGGYLIAPAANIVISPYVIHRNPRFFPDPEQFDPDRFLSEPARYSYLPFGAGPRVCIGQPFAMLELALVLVTVLQRYRFILPPTYSAEPEPMMTLRPKGGLPMMVLAMERAHLDMGHADT